ncbi:IS3 family transposase [Paenibacillus odorifer]
MGSQVNTFISCFYNSARFQAKLNNLSPYNYRTQTNKY